MNTLINVAIGIPVAILAARFWINVWNFLVRNRKTLGKRVQVAKDAFFTVTREG